MKKIVVFDLVRGIAVLMVFTGHLGILFPANGLSDFWRWIWYRSWVNGAYGVSLFFVISGFLITRLIAESPGGLFKPDFRDFYARRAGRILPLLCLFCVLGLTLAYVVPLSVDSLRGFFYDRKNISDPLFWVSIGTFWFNWFRIFPHEPIGFYWGILWSLSVEEQFYFFYPLVLLLIRSERNLIVLLLIFVALGPVSQWVGYSHGWNHLVIHYNSFNGFDLVALGALRHLVCEKWRAALWKRPAISWLLAALGAALVFKIYFHQPYFADYWGNRFDDLLIGLGLFIFLLGALHLECFNSKIWLPGVWVGRLSYGMYLYQASVFCVLFPFLTEINSFISFLIAASAIWLVSALSFYLYEKPANQWIRGFLAVRIKS
jgi:peptidoglycan/LPS O-acetylase OafA/YrhL